MCRLLLVKSDSEFEIAPFLEKFAAVCENSREFQGHGWGMAYLNDGKRELYRSVTPIWKDSLESFGSTRFLIVHARSAFQDTGIDVINNMPFVDDRYVFVFNGELRGVKIKAEGRIGAEKIFNVIRRFNKGDMEAALRRSVGFIEKRTGHIRAMNMMVTDMENVYLCSYFNGEEDYFTMYKKQEGTQLIICSERFPGESDWDPIPNRRVASMLLDPLNNGSR